MIFRSVFSALQNLVLCLALLFLFCRSASAQQVTIRGKVVDSETLSPLAFVNIVANNGSTGACTDIDGKFTLKSATPVKILKLTYVGYFNKQVSVDSLPSDKIIKMQKTEVELQEVVIRPGINPAHRIIGEVLANRNLNDHEKLESFSYTSYEKTIFGPDKDSIPMVDSLAADTAFLHMKRLFDSQHLFLMESVVERKFMYPDKNYNNVLASRVSGMSDPLFVFMMSQLQSTSFYREIIKIGDKEYINPISNGTFTKYYFEILDTLVEPHPYDTTFIISFRPLLNTNFDGLKGVISISTNNYAIRNVIAEPSRPTGIFTIKIQQLYEFVGDEHWFPLQLNTDLIFKGAIGKNTIEIGAGPGPVDSTRIDLVGRGKSYISDIKLNPPLKTNRFGYIEVDVQPDAYHRSEEDWNQYRVDSLTPRDTMTYHVIDSLGRKERFNEMGQIFDALANGSVPLGVVDFELNRFLNANSHEGIRLGAGIKTNDLFSKYFSLGGYGAYGFDDRKFKYGGNALFKINRFRETEFSVALNSDVSEPGAMNPFTNGNGLLKPENYRSIYVIQMDHTEKQEVALSGRIFNYLKVKASFSRRYCEPLYNYSYTVASSENIDVSRNAFYFTEASLTLRYAYGEKFIKNTRSIISMGTSHPEIWFHYCRGLTVAGGDYVYNRFDIKIRKTFSTKYFGKTTLDAEGGFFDRGQPYVNLYNSLGSYRPFGLWSVNSFATMRMGEFSADKYAAVFISHNFGKLLFRSKHFNPEPVLVTNAGFGSLRNAPQHNEKDVKDFHYGYYESGLVLNNIVSMGFAGVGVGAFYRYGPYSLPAIKDNLALKITVSVSF